MAKKSKAEKAVDQLGAKWSSNLDDYISGKIPASQIKCALCGNAPCRCPEFGSQEYFDLINKVHGL